MSIFYKKISHIIIKLNFLLTYHAQGLHLGRDSYSMTITGLEETVGLTYITQRKTKLNSIKKHNMVKSST